MIIIVITTVGQLLSVRPAFNYTAGASLWVEQSLYLEENPYQQLDPLASAATSNAQLLTSLIGTPGFLTGVAARVSARGYTMTPQAADNLKGAIFRNTKIITKGNVLIQLEYADPDERLALIVLNSIIEAYNEFSLNLLRTEGQASISYLESQVTQLKRQSDTIDNQVNKFIADNPNLNKDDPTGVIPFLTQQDFTYSILLLNQTDIKRQYNNLQTQLEKLRINISAIVSGKIKLINVEDEPFIVFSFTYDNTFRFILAAGIGLVGGLFLAILAGLLITWWNSSLQDIDKARAQLRGNLVLSIPAQSTDPLKKLQATLTGAGQTAES